MEAVAASYGLSYQLTLHPHVVVLRRSAGDVRHGTAHAHRAGMSAFHDTHRGGQISPCRSCRRRRFSQCLRESKGSNLIEAAIVLPLLSLVCFSVAEYGFIFYVKLVLQNRVSQATRFGITGAVLPGQSRAESIRSAMRQATPTLTIDDTAFTFAHLPAGASTWLAGTGPPNSIEKVTVDYYWPIVTAMMRRFFPNDEVHFQVESAMKNEGDIEL